MGYIGYGCIGLGICHVMGPINQPKQYDTVASLPITSVMKLGQIFRGHQYVFEYCSKACNVYNIK